MQPSLISEYFSHPPKKSCLCPRTTLHCLSTHVPALEEIFWLKKIFFCFFSLFGEGLLVVYCDFRRRQWHSTPVLLPGKSHGQRSLIGCSPWGRWGLDTTERLHFDFSLSCIGEGNGNPLQCSCLENPRDGEAWWAAVYGVTQSQAWLKWLSSSREFKCLCISLFYHT